MKQERLFGIIYILLSQKQVTASYLAENFEVSVRTIYRDIELLSILGIPIYMNKGKNGGIKLIENYKLDKTLLTAEEQKSILFSLQGMSELNIDTENLFKKLKSVFDNNDDTWFEIDFSYWGNSEEYKKNLI